MYGECIVVGLDDDVGCGSLVFPVPILLTAYEVFFFYCQRPLARACLRGFRRGAGGGVEGVHRRGRKDVLPQRGHRGDDLDPPTAPPASVANFGNMILFEQK